MLDGQEPCIVEMEACATSHYWARVAQSSGHDVRLVPPIYVKPFVKRQKMGWLPPSPHAFDPATSIEETLEALDTLVRAGDVR